MIIWQATKNIFPSFGNKKRVIAPAKAAGVMTYFIEHRMINITLSPDHDNLIKQAAQLLVEAFREHWPDAWPTIEAGLREVHEMLETGRICRVAVDDKGNLLGIIGGIPGYSGNVWELHPLAVQPPCRDRASAARWAKRVK